ncbi:MAG: penicillin-binding transpeptidase domain-containing protein [Paenibacillaceae bacterium]
MIIIRLLWLQTLNALGVGELVGYLARGSVEQRLESVVLDQGRGRILDRSGAILAGVQVKALLIVPLMPQWHDPDLIGQVAAILGMKPNVLDSQARLTHKPFLVYTGFQKIPIVLSSNQIKQLEQIQSPALKVVPYVRRYQGHPIAAHVIGYLGQNPRQLKEWYPKQLEQGIFQENDLIGAAGIERAFDRFLQGIEPSRYVHFVDGKSEALAGLQDRLISPDNPFYPLQLWTTLDGKLQAETEAMLDDIHMKEGAVVVLDIENSDVVVMASRPNYDPYSVLPELGEWRNRAVSAEIPGSIFKTVVLAAALEDGIVKPGQKFYCSGEWDRYHLRCWVREGHGVLTLEQAYAQSCNVIIAQIAAKLDPGRLEEVAESLGLLHRIGWSADRLSFPSGSMQSFRQFDGEQEGQLFDRETPKTDLGVMAQTGIGQRDVRLSPLQAANMVVTLLNAGQLKEPRIVTEIRHNNNRSLLQFPQHLITRPLHKGKKGISPSTARWLTEAMKLTVQAGTASSLLKVPVEVAGKTGTAETGQLNERKVNQWFIGYTPTQQPKYAFAVLVSNRSQGEQHQALAITDQLIRLLGE